MQTLGERLEEARKRKGLSIREAAEATKIRGDYLQKFESNSFNLDLPPLYVRGFVRAYARYLEFDPQRFLAEYDSVMAGETRPTRRETRENFGRVEFGDAAEPSTGRKSGGSTPDPMLLKYGLYGGGALVLIIVVILLINLFSGSSSRPATNNAQQATTQPQTAAPEATPQQLTFTALDNTRIKIIRDSNGAVLFDGTLSRGETRTFQKVGILRITVEDRTKLRMEVNGRSTDIPQFPSGNYGRFYLD